ncbi:PQQ-binding-like beta-propeller repeat protein [Halorussus sp. MSC15.2]|uniref:outer membrane protein assembly factor BamB family protein n=1 Tax=Halorussus sp. MSC15.2 TaxID=2283638 RepID=UPI0013D4A2FF|nr:PQQ-binding-like beta-propeller repeat protein [Halorussus sp. MSC15.2]NEU55425.1 PQQ-binding-like beta-propeller repeat protein [Halorussus sp. MSC15.2]
MVSRETSRRTFLLGAGGLGGASRSAADTRAVGTTRVSATGQPAVGVPGIDTDHRVRWTFETDAAATVYPPVRTREALVTLVRSRSDGESQYEVCALDAETGQTRWRRELDGRSTFPKAADGLVYVVDGERLRALDANDGSDRWRVATGNLDYRNVVVGDGAVVTAADGRVTATDAAQGGELWTTELDGEDRLAGPLLDDERVYLGGTGGYYALGREDGRQRWVARTPEEERTWAAEVRDGLLVGWSDEAVYGLRVGDGTRRWRTPHERLPPHPAMGTVTADTVFVWGQSLAAIDVRTGEKRWTFGGDGDRGHGVETDGDGVYFSVGDGLVAVDAESGRERWRADTGSGNNYWGTVRDGLVYAVGRTGTAAIDAGSGDERWRLDFADDRGLWADVVGDLALVATQSGTLYAVDRPSPLATAPLAAAGRFATSPSGLGLFGLLGAGLLGVGYRRATRETPGSDSGAEFGRLDRLGGGPVTETYRERVRTPDGPTLVAETRVRDGVDTETRRPSPTPSSGGPTSPGRPTASFRFGNSTSARTATRFRGSGPPSSRAGRWPTHGRSRTASASKSSRASPGRSTRPTARARHTADSRPGTSSARRRTRASAT